MKQSIELSNHMPTVSKRQKEMVSLYLHFPPSRILFHGWAEETGPPPAGEQLYSSQSSAFGVKNSKDTWNGLEQLFSSPLSICGIDACQPRASARSWSLPGKHPEGGCVQFITKWHSICAVCSAAQIHKSKPIKARWEFLWEGAGIFLS